MNSNKHRHLVAAFWVCAFAVLYGLQFPVSSFAQGGQASATPAPTCTVTPSPTPNPVPLPTCTPCDQSPPPTTWPSPYVEIPNFYQPPNGTRLAWIVHTPPPTPTPSVSPAPSPPGVLVIHPGGWYAGSAQQVGRFADDIAAAGYCVVAVEHELARCGYIVKQPCHEDDDPTPGSLVTRETNDIKALVNALRADPHVDSTKIGVVGGSAGATLAVYVALDATDSGNNGQVWPYWKADKRPQCAVMLSAAYDFSDMTPPPGHSEIDFSFLLGTQNFVNSSDLSVLRSYSPVALVTPDNTNPLVPLFMINTYYDSPPPYHQIVDMICAFRSIGVSDSAYKTLTIMNSDEHSFGYWDSPDKLPSTVQTPLIKDDVIAFLDAHLK